jgi:glycosyltransferase involved in cell wall biosynthesis
LSAREPEAPAWPPRFSIVVTFYNQRDFIKDALDSALALRNAGLEIIAVDDASTDGSPGILKQYQDSIQVVCLENNQGACAARNRGASLATGDYLVFLDGDDAFLPWALDVYARIVQAKKPKMILSTMWWFEGALSAVPPGATPLEITMVDYSDLPAKRSAVRKQRQRARDRARIIRGCTWMADGFLSTGGSGSGA